MGAKAKAKSSAAKQSKSKAKQAAMAAVQKATSPQSARYNTKIVDRGEKRKTRELDAEVLRCIKKKLPGVTEPQLYGHVVEGKNLWDRARLHKLEMAAAGKYVTDEFWDEWIPKYDLMQMKKAVQVVNTEESLDPKLLQYIDIAESKDGKIRSRQPLCSWFRQVTVLNQREVCGVVTYVGTLKPAANPEAALMVIDFMKMVERLQLKKNFRKEIESVAHLGDEALVWTWEQMKKKKQTRAKWYARYSTLLAIGHNVDQFRMLCNRTAEWEKVSGDLHQARSHTKLGKVMFSDLGTYIVGAKVAKLVKARIEVWQKMEQTKLIQDMVDEALRTIVEEARNAILNVFENNFL